MAALDRWKYYVASYTMRDQTEGVPQHKTWLPYLRRNLPPVLDTLEEYNRIYSNPQNNQDGLQMRINSENYHLQYEPFSADWFVHDDTVRKMGLSGIREVSEERKQKFEDKFVKNPRWMAGMSKEEVEKRIEETASLIKGGTEAVGSEAPPPPPQPQQQQSDDHGDEKIEQDEVMTAS